MQATIHKIRVLNQDLYCKITYFNYNQANQSSLSAKIVCIVSGRPIIRFWAYNAHKAAIYAQYGQTTSDTAFIEYYCQIWLLSQVTKAANRLLSNSIAA
jgi:hypothetical protein